MFKYSYGDQTAEVILQLSFLNLIILKLFFLLKLFLVIIINKLMLA